KTDCVIKPTRRYSLDELISARGIALMKQADLLHVPHPFHLPGSERYRTVLSIHDLTQLLYPPSLRARLLKVPYRRFLREVCLRADALIAPSCFTRDWFHDALNIADKRIDVVYEAADSVFGVERNIGAIAEFKRKY